LGSEDEKTIRREASFGQTKKTTKDPGPERKKNGQKSPDRTQKRANQKKTRKGKEAKKTGKGGEPKKP
jgi:hypothetical protein